MGTSEARDERQVGHVVAVSTYRITVLIDTEIRSQVRAYPQHITVVSQIGGYVLFPVAPGEMAVGIVVGASEYEAIEPESNESMTLQLARARRVIRLNLLGQLHADRFVAGISTYPTLDTPALLPTDAELARILRYQPIDARDTALDIGASPLYARQAITASYNDLLARPLGVIGNTGSGKSYTVASILQRALLHEDRSAKHARVLILDINGEYSTAFVKSAPPTRDLNMVYCNGAEFHLPLWMFNLSELEHFFEAADRSQRPVLERVVTALREATLDADPSRELRQAVRRIDQCLGLLDKLAVRFADPVASYAGDNARNILEHLEFSLAGFAETPEELAGALPESVTEYEETLRDVLEADMPQHNIPPATVDTGGGVIDRYRVDLGQLRDLLTTRADYRRVTADSPIPFDIEDLLRDEAFELVLSRFRGQARIQEYLATLRLRIHRQLADERWRVFTKSPEVEFSQVVDAIAGLGPDRATVIDCSMLAHDVLPFFCAVLGRLLLELREHAPAGQRTVQPMVLVLEEAHNYLRPRRDDETHGVRLAREAFERIAKEGRKFGLSLVIASQRPSDVSATVISQCANFVVHRIQNPEDIDYFKKILPTGSRDLLDQLPILAPGDGLLLGSAVNVPVRAQIRKPVPAPSSDTPRPWEAWKAGQPRFDIAGVTAAWSGAAAAADDEDDDEEEIEWP